MIISNLRTENKDGKTYLITDVSCSFTQEGQLWFSLPEEDGEMFSDDVYDAFMVAALFPCMYYNEPIEIEGKVSKELYYNLARYVHSIITAFRPEMKKVDIRVSGFAVAQQSDKKIVGTGYSGGVDSFSTIVEHFVNEPEEEYRINHLFFFNLGQYGDMNTAEARQRAYNRYLLCKQATDCIGLPYSFMDTNLFKFYKPEWEHLSDELNRTVAILSMQRMCCRYYTPSAHTYLQHQEFKADHNADLASFAEHMLTNLLCTESCKIVLDGSQYTRFDKIDIIKNYKPAQRYLNVCTNTNEGHTDSENCSICGKCCRTMCELELLGILDNFSAVFKTEQWKKNKYRFLCETRLSYKSSIYGSEIIDVARKKHVRIPFYLEALVVSYSYRIIRKINKMIRHL